ncbi:MAG: MFS transporter [Gordonia sp. (in: high G+C Gram-positive bacteria)]
MSGKVRGLLIDVTPLRESVAFRRVFIARCISLIGIGLLLVAVPVQMYQLTGSSFQVGAATAVTGAMTFVGMLSGGVLADRFDRKRLILVGRSAAAVSFAALAANAFGAFGGEPSTAAVYGIAAFDGLIGALSAAALMAAVPTLISRDLLVAVGALSSLSVRIAGALSPGIAGFLIAGFGVGWTYTVAAVLATFTVLILLGLPSMPPHAEVLGAAGDGPSGDGAPEAEAVDAEANAGLQGPGSESSGSAGSVSDDAVAEPQAGDQSAAHDSAADAPPSLAAFLRHQPVVGSVIVLGVLSMLGAGIVALLPGLVAERFGGDSRATGLLFAAVALGATISALTSGWLSSVRRPGTLLLAVLAAGFTIQVLFGLSPLLIVALVLLGTVGFLDAIGEVLRYSLIQQHTPGPLLGRVNGIWIAQEVGGVTVGSLVAGALGSIWAPSTAIVFYGLGLLVLAVVAALSMRSLNAVRHEPREAVPART